MGESRYGKPLRDGRWAIEFPCHICGAKPKQKCWDLRSPIGTVVRLTPHQQRGRDDSANFAMPVYQRKFDTAKFAKHTKGSIELTKRNYQVLVMMCNGMTDAHIARALGCHLGGAKQYVRDVQWRLGANGRTQAVHLAYYLGLLTVDADTAESRRAEYRLKHGHPPQKKKRR